MAITKPENSPHDKKTYEGVPVPDYPKKINIGIQEDICNLSCPKCLVFGTNTDTTFDITKVATSSISMDNVIRILDEIKDHDTAINLGFWVEPLVIKSFRAVLVAAKERGVPVGLNTNGLLVTPKMAEFLVDHVSSVSVSIDSTTEETLMKTRSTTRLETVHAAVFNLLEKRGDRETPRISVSFTEEDCNRHEREEFLEYWLQHVDSVRVNEMYTYERGIDNIVVSRDRTPCREIYDQMIIDFNGDVRMCCVDGYRVTNLGNVFENGVHGVWHGEALSKTRKNHEEGNYAAQPFCESCTLWASYNIADEREEGNLLIRSSDSITFYNRLDRIKSWKPELRRNDLEFTS